MRGARNLSSATAVPKACHQTQPISSRDNPWLKKFRAALQHGERPDGLVGVEGPRLIEEAFRSGLEVTALLVSPSGDRHLRRFSEWLNDQSARAHLHLLRTSDRIFGSVAGTQTPQGVAALVSPREFQFDDLLRGPRHAMTTNAPLVVVLVGVQDPGNVGTIFRSAEAFGASGVVTAQGTADPLSPKALRASAGTAFRLPAISHVALPVVLAQLGISQLTIFAACSAPRSSASQRELARRQKSPAAPEIVSAARQEQSPIEIQADLRGPTALLIGNEGAGLPEEVVRSAYRSISIPVASGVESLNAAVATSVLLYEAARQRRGKE